MSRVRDSDWNPNVEQDASAIYDEMRLRCPVAHSATLGWSAFRHADVVRVLDDHETFSNVVSSHLSVPNGMDPPQHTTYRRALEPFFEPERMRVFEPVCSKLAAELVVPLIGAGSIELMERLAMPFAVRCQCAFLGWPEELVEPLRRWTLGNQEATRAVNRKRLAELAREFRALVDGLLVARRTAAAFSDVTSSLMDVQVSGRPLNDDELTSIFRNWTVGEVGSLASGLGIVAHGLAVHAELQERLRAQPALVPSAVEEILRVMGPLVLNRRIAKRDVELSGRHIAAGERLSLMWISANRDPEVFDCPAEIRIDRDQRDNLLYGRGIHACPGAPLARLELRVAVEELLRLTRVIELDTDRPPRRAAYPANGWESLPLRLQG